MGNIAAHETVFISVGREKNLRCSLRTRHCEEDFDMATRNFIPGTSSQGKARAMRSYKRVEWEEFEGEKDEVES